MTKRFVIATAAPLCVLLSCLVFGPVVAAQTVPPAINSISGPATPSGYVEVIGTGFGSTGTVLIDGVPSIVATWTDTRVVAYVPEAARLGSVGVEIRNAAGASNAVTLAVIARVQAGRLRWRLRMDAPYSFVRPAVGVDGTIYTIDVYGRLYAVSSTGALRWIARAAGSKGVAVGQDGTVYTGDENWIKAFAPDGTLKWTFVQSPRAFILLDVAVGPDGNVYAVATEGLGVFSLTPTGSLRWATPEPYRRPIVDYSEIQFGPGVDGRQQLYFAANSHLRAIRLENGAEAFTIGAAVFAVSPFNGTVHYPSASFRADGVLQWQFPEFLNGAPTLGADGVHYATTSMSVPRLFAIDVNGSERWRVVLNDQSYGSDLDPSNRFVVVAGSNTLNYPGVVLAHAASSGARLWRMELPAEETTVFNDWTGLFGFNQYVDSRAAFSATSDTVYLMTAIATGGVVTDRAFLNAIDTTSAVGTPSTLLRSASVQLTGRARRGSVTITGTVRVVDQNRVPIAGAMATVKWTLPNGSTLVQTARTGSTGAATFQVTGGRGFYTLTVTNLARPGYTFDPTNSVLSQTIVW
jgi:hypothetical protein